MVLLDGRARDPSQGSRGRLSKGRHAPAADLSAEIDDKL
jgi:hypothetical protein